MIFSVAENIFATAGKKKAVAESSKAVAGNLKATAEKKKAVAGNLKAIAEKKKAVAEKPSANVIQQLKTFLYRNFMRYFSLRNSKEKS